MNKIKFNHLGLFTQQPKRILNFYLRGLGFTKEYQTLLPGNVMYPIFKINHECHMAKLIRDDIALEVFWFAPLETKEKSGRRKMSLTGFENYKLKEARIGTAGYNHFGVEVKDRQKFCNTLAKRFGIKVIKIRRQDHYNYFIQDPDKNLIEVKEAVYK